MNSWTPLAKIKIALLWCEVKTVSLSTKKNTSFVLHLFFPPFPVHEIRSAWEINRTCFPGCVVTLFNEVWWLHRKLSLPIIRKSGSHCYPHNVIGETGKYRRDAFSEIIRRDMIARGAEAMMAGNIEKRGGGGGGEWEILVGPRRQTVTGRFF